MCHRLRTWEPEPRRFLPACHTLPSRPVGLASRWERHQRHIGVVIAADVQGADGTWRGCVVSGAVSPGALGRSRPPQARKVQAGAKAAAGGRELDRVERGPWWAARRLWRIEARGTSEAVAYI